MQIFSENKIRKSIVNLKELPTSIEFIQDKPSIAHFDDGTTLSLGCLNCKNPLCMKYRESELNFDLMPLFSFDTNQNVCPVEAITWDEKNNYPVIDENKCIECGLCIKRCPSGSLYFNKTVKVNTELSEKQFVVEAENTSENIQIKQIDALCKCQKVGTFILESEKLLNEIYEKLTITKHDIHNLIVRNLLLGLNCKSAISRIGDVYTRMDAVYATENCIGPIEVEFGSDTLKASRGILDDIAVMNCRYSIRKERCTPLVVCLHMPNARQGYWQVVKDIKNVEEIKINTATIGILLILLWNNKNLDLHTNPLYLDFENMNAFLQTEAIIDRKIRLSESILGIFAPQK